MYHVCLKSNGTVHAPRTTFIAEKKALLSMMSQCLVVSKTKFQHFVTTTFFLRRISVEQQFNQKFLVRLGKTPTEVLKLLQESYCHDTMRRTRLFEWHRRFKEGREEVEDDHRSGRPSTSRTDENVEHVRQKMRSDRRLTARMIADELGMNSESDSESEFLFLAHQSNV